MASVFKDFVLDEAAYVELLRKLISVSVRLPRRDSRLRLRIP
jgi:hypothetical protein